MWQALAGLAVVLHCTYLGFVTVGALLALRTLRWIPLHLLCVLWALVVVAVQGRCPITTLEKWFLTQGGETPSRGATCPPAWHDSAWALTHGHPGGRTACNV